MSTEMDKCKNVHLMKLFGKTGVLIGMFFLFCSQDEVSNDPRRLRAVLGLDETNDEMASGNVSFSETKPLIRLLCKLVPCSITGHVCVKSISQ